MSKLGSETGFSASIASQRLKFFTHQLLAGLAKSSPIWGYPAVIAGDNYPFVNQRAAQVPTIFLDFEVEDCSDGTIRVLGTLLTEAIRSYSERGDSSLGLQLLTMNDKSGHYTLVVQALNAKDPYELISLLSFKRDLILHNAFEIIDHLYEDQEAAQLRLQYQ
jgi:hypothetical protein